MTSRSRAVWIHRKSVRVLCGIGLLVTCTSLSTAQSVTVQAIGKAWQAAAGNHADALIVVRLTNADGSPFSNALTKLDPNPQGGLQLCRGGAKSPWCIETVLTPPAFGANLTTYKKDSFGNVVASGQEAVQGQLRVMQIWASERGAYLMRISPTAGSKGKVKIYVNWISGDYVFHLLYDDGVKKSDVLGVLTIK